MLKVSTFAPMGKKTIDRLSIYESLVGIILPPEMLKFFEVVKVEEKSLPAEKAVGAQPTVIHIHLDERKWPEEECQGLRPNGFTEPCMINDFPIRDRKVVLHVRRRRWLTEDGHNKVENKYDITAEGTNYSKEFAGVLKKIFGYLPDYGPFAGAVFQD